MAKTVQHQCSAVSPTEQNINLYRHRNCFVIPTILTLVSNSMSSSIDWSKKCVCSIICM